MSPPEFSIICRSEGGPATHVYWFSPKGRVQEDSDHETSQIIVDTSHNSVYENKLRVRGREGGTYRCTVIRNQYQLNETISFVAEQADIMGL